jgi:hypothetical protein
MSQHANAKGAPGISGQMRTFPIFTNTTPVRLPARMPINAVPIAIPTRIPEPAVPKTVLLPIPNFNPYLLLSMSTIDNIARERDIMIHGTRENKAAMLYELDGILPEWRDDVRTKNNMTFRQLVGVKLQYYAALHGLDMKKILLTKTIDLLDFIELATLNRNNDNRRALQPVVSNTRRHILEAVVIYMGLDAGLSTLVPPNELRAAVVNNNIAHINHNQLKQWAIRRNFLANHKYAQQLAKIYKTDKWEQVVLLPIHPMEKIIMDLDMLDTQMLMDTFGIVVPISHSNNIRDYVLQNIAHYSAVLTRGSPEIVTPNSLMFMGYDKIKQYFSELRDIEIFSYFGAYVPYNSREGLIENLLKIVFNTTFFVPCPPSTKLSINKETPVSMMTFDETEQFFIAYGNIGNYYTYEISELVGAFHRNEGGVIDFRRPENITSTFTVAEVQDLALLLKCYTPTKYITDLLTAIQTGIEELEERVASDGTILAEFKLFSDADKQHIRKFLYEIFYIGMYMRRWKGPGHPYPLTGDAASIELDPNNAVTELLVTTTNFLNGLDRLIISFCMRLKVCEYKGGHIECGRKELSREWTDVLDAKRCIRQASTMYIGTAYHYLIVLFNERIPNLDVKQVEAIL